MEETIEAERLEAIDRAAELSDEKAHVEEAAQKAQRELIAYKREVSIPGWLFVCLAPCERVGRVTGRTTHHSSSKECARIARLLLSSASFGCVCAQRVCS